MKYYSYSFFKEERARIMFKVETHLHTSEVSPCSRKRAQEMVRIYKEKGYSTVFVTDHFQSDTIDSYGDIPWEDKMAIFLSGYYRAKNEGNKQGIVVLPGAEFRFPDTENHYLAYGITKEFLDSHPEIHKTDIETFSKIAHEAGIFIVQAHPYRDGKCFPTPLYIDAVEVYNANPRHNDYNAMAEYLACKYGIPVSAGSDSHRDEDIALSGIETDTEICSTEDFVNLIKNGKARIIREHR